MVFGNVSGRFRVAHPPVHHLHIIAKNLYNGGCPASSSYDSDRSHGFAIEKTFPSLARRLLSVSWFRNFSSLVFDKPASPIAARISTDVFPAAEEDKTEMIFCTSGESML